jgi:hypothetical protein
MIGANMRIWLAVALTLICTVVFGHGSEQWINDAKLVDPVSRMLCCGPIDCSALAPGSVEREYRPVPGLWSVLRRMASCFTVLTRWQLPHLYYPRRIAHTESQVLHRAAEFHMIG